MNTNNEIEYVLEAAQQLANDIDQRVAIFTDTKGGIHYDALDAVTKFGRILEVISPAPSDVEWMIL